MPDEPASDPAPVAVAPPVVAPPSPAAPAPAPAPGAVTLAIVEPFRIHEFVSGIDGWDPITRAGTAGPAGTVDQVIAAGVSSGVTLERR